MFFGKITAKLLSMYTFTPCIDHLHFDLLYYSKNTLGKKNMKKKNMINSLMLILKKKKLHSSKPLNDKLVTVPKAWVFAIKIYFL